MPPGQDQYVSLPDGSYVHVPGDATPQQLDQLRTKLSTQYAGRPIADTSTISAAPKPSLLEQAKAPFQEVGAPLWNATVGGISSIPLVGKYLPNLRAEETPASGTAVSNIENLTQQGRAEHPLEAKIGDLFRNAGQLSRTISPEIATLGIADAGSSIPDATGRIPQAFAKTFRNPEGEIAVTPSAILDRVIPQRSEIIGKQTAEDLQSRMQEAEDARQKELADMEKLREQDAQSKITRGEEQSKIDTANELRLREAENARQKELAAQERLREQHARSLISREEAQSKLEETQRVPVIARNEMYEDLAQRRMAREREQQSINEENRLPIKARQEMYDELGSRRIARGEAQSKIDAENESRLKEIENSRQRELADQERLREQHARSLNARKEPTAETSPFSGAGVTSTAGIPPSGIPHVPRPVSGIEPGIPQVSSTNPLLDVSLSAPKIVPRTTGAAQKPFEPLIYESEGEANAIDRRNANLKRQASAAGTFHAAQGGVGKKLNLQQRIARRYGGTP